MTTTNDVQFVEPVICEDDGSQTTSDVKAGIPIKLVGIGIGALAAAGTVIGVAATKREAIKEKIDEKREASLIKKQEKAAASYKKFQEKKLEKQKKKEATKTEK